MYFKTQDALKHHVERLKAFYNEFYSFLIVIAFSLLVWLLSDGGYFWPVWIIVLWGGPIFFKASKLEILDISYYKLLCSLRDQLPFLKKSWESEKLQELQKNLKESDKTIVDNKAQHVKAPIKKAAPKKMAVKKPVISKNVTQKAPTKKSSPAKSVTKKAPIKKGPTKTAPAKKTPIKKDSHKKA